MKKPQIWILGAVLLASLARGATPAEALRLACHAGAVEVGSFRAWPEAEA